MVYVPKTSPMEVRLCMDQSRDMCEALCSADLRFDLGPALRFSGATEVNFVAPK
jgi:hypothetical protein